MTSINSSAAEIERHADTTLLHHDDGERTGPEPKEPVKHQPYMDNDAEIDSIDYTCIMDSFGEMNLISTQVWADVMDEIQCELDSRPAA